MSSYNEMIGKKAYVGAGEYTIVADLGGGGHGDNNIALYLGRAADGHHDMIASDNASMWAVGDENDAGRNRDQWCTIAARCDVEPVLAEVRKIDGDLADWLADRYHDAQTAMVIVAKSDYDNGDISNATVVNCTAADDYDAIAECWDDIGVDDIIVRGIGDIGDLSAIHLAAVGDDTRTIDGLGDLKADYYAAIYSTAEGDGDCGDWEYYSADGRRLTTDEEAFGA